MTLSREEKERRNIRTTERATEWQNSGNIDATLAIMTEDSVWESPALEPYPGRLVGKNGTRWGLTELGRVFPDIFQRQLAIYADNDTVIQVTHNSGTRTNGFMGLPPIQKPWEFVSAGFFTYTEDGLVKRTVLIWDRGGVLGQLGVVPRVGLFGSAPGKAAEWGPCLGAYSGSPPWRGVSATGGAAGGHDLVDVVAEIFQFPLLLMFRSVRMLLLKEGESGRG